MSVGDCFSIRHLLAKIKLGQWHIVKNWSFWVIKALLGCRYHILSDSNPCVKTSANIQKIWKKMCKLQVSRPKRVTNKCNIIRQWIKGLRHSKTPLVAIKTKTLSTGQKVDFLIQPSNQVECWTDSWDVIFPFEMIVYRPKLEIKRMRYQQNTKRVIK